MFEKEGRGSRELTHENDRYFQALLSSFFHKLKTDLIIYPLRECDLFERYGISFVTSEKSIRLTVFAS